jgi:hypothetical protein
MGSCGANRTIFIVYIVAVRIDVAIIVHVGCIVIIVTGGPEPPPRRMCQSYPYMIRLSPYQLRF